MTIKIGDTVSIPKGTLVLDGSGAHDFTYADHGTFAPSKRASTAKVSNVVKVPRWWYLMSEKNRERIEQAGVRYWRSVFERDGTMSMFSQPPVITPALQALIDEIKAETDALWGDYTMVSWSDDDKHCAARDVVAVAVTIEKKPKEQTITKRRQMVPGSVWRFTRECQIDLYVDNRERQALIQSRHQGTGYAGDKEIMAMPEMVIAKVATVEAGTLITISGKAETSSVGYGKNEFSNGIMFPVTVEGNIEYHRGGLRTYRDTIRLPYRAIENFIEAVSIPETIAYALRNSKTGEFFGGWEQEKHRGYNRTSDIPKMSATFSGAKKYANLAALKASIMDFTGYHNGLSIDGYVGEWVGNGDKKIDLPPEWEGVAIDKTTNTEREVIDIQSWYGELIRLRTITAKVNSAVRGVFKKIEGNGDYAAIVSFEIKDDDRDDEKMEPSDLADIRAAMANADGKTVMHSTPFMRAFAVMSQTDATMVLLGYTGRGIATAYDASDLSEMVIKREAENAA